VPLLEPSRYARHEATATNRNHQYVGSLAELLHELYGDGVWGRNPTEPRPLDGRVLDVPEFKPGD